MFILFSRFFFAKPVRQQRPKKCRRRRWGVKRGGSSAWQTCRKSLISCKSGLMRDGWISQTAQEMIENPSPWVTTQYALMHINTQPRLLLLGSARWASPSPTGSFPHLLPRNSWVTSFCSNASQSKVNTSRFSRKKTQNKTKSLSAKNYFHSWVCFLVFTGGVNMLSSSVTSDLWLHGSVWAVKCR